MRLNRTIFPAGRPKLLGFAASVLVIGGCSGSGSPTADQCGLKPEVIGSFVTIPAGEYKRTGQALYPEEQSGLPRRQLIASFQLQRHEVTNDQFAKFVAATGYVTDAEKNGSAVFAEDKPASIEQASQHESSQSPSRWQLSNEAFWRRPEGMNSSIDGLGLHPVVHVSLRDARAYASWAGGRLPTEAEWEYAASKGLASGSATDNFAVAEKNAALGKTANTWQGLFPFHNSADDGFRRTAPVGCFAADANGAVDMIGNVWEWTDSAYQATDNSAGAGQFAIKGGSYLCAANFCRRYRPAARQAQDGDFSTSHTGFRIVKVGRE